MSEVIKINGVDYPLADMKDEQLKLIQQLKMVENLGEALNYSHDYIVYLLSQEFPNEPAE